MTPLRDAIATPEGKRRYVRALFATIANRYDFITRALSYGQDRRWKRRLVRLADITPADRVLDLACGTGDILFETLHRDPRRTVGIDLTHRMLVLARQRNRAHPPRPPITLIAADMSVLPLHPASFDVITTGYGLRNVPDIQQAIHEIHRVLAPRGRLLSLDFNRPANRLVRTLYLAYLSVVGSLLGLVLHGDADTYRYIPESIRTYPGDQGIARMLENEGFREVRILPVLFGLMTIHMARKV